MVKPLQLERGILTNEATAKKWLHDDVSLAITRNIGYIRLNVAEISNLCVGDVLLLDNDTSSDISQQQIILGDVDDSLYERWN